MISTVSFNRMVRWALASIARSISSSTTMGTHSRGSWRLQLQLQKKKKKLIPMPFSLCIVSSNTLDGNSDLLYFFFFSVFFFR
jgi:hypothetical protein